MPRVLPLRMPPFPVQTDFGIAFAVSGAAHCEIHTDFGAFAFEVGAQTFDDVGGSALRDADDVFCRPHSRAFFLLIELLSGGFADGALFGCFVAFVNVTANGTDKFRHSFFSFRYNSILVFFYFVGSAAGNCVLSARSKSCAPCLHMGHTKSAGSFPLWT